MTKGDYFVLLFGILVVLALNFFIVFDFKTNKPHTMTTSRIVGLTVANLIGIGGLWLIYKKYIDIIDFNELLYVYVLTQ